MSRRIHMLNLFGVLVLAVLCALQWRGNRSLNLEVNRLEMLRQEQTGLLAGREKTIKGQAADLEDFRAQLDRALGGLKESEISNSAHEQRVRQLSREADALKANIAEWAAAVSARDERLREANDRIVEAAARADEAVRKFNRLATDYNDVVRQLNAERAAVRAAAPVQPPPP